jgi:hypothetical protein
MAKTIYEQGREAFGVIDPRNCPYQDEACRAAWFKGYEDAERDFENN